MQAALKERLLQSIQNSNILTKAEKSDWLDMLPIMDDKQAGELEAILKAEAATATVAPAPGAIPANLPILTPPAALAAQPVKAPIAPAQLIAKPAVAAPATRYLSPNLNQPPTRPSVAPSPQVAPVVSRPAAASVPTPAPVPPQSQLNISAAKPAAALHAAPFPLPDMSGIQPHLSKPMPVIPNMAPVAQSMPHSHIVMTPPVIPPQQPLQPPVPITRSTADDITPPSVKKSPEPQAQPIASPAERVSVKPLLTKLETVTDAGNLSVSSLRSMKPDDLLLRLCQLVKLEGYFNMLSYLEDSSLYKTYIATGKKVLAGQLQFSETTSNPGQDPTLLTKQEFEMWVDILKKIQIN